MNLRRSVIAFLGLSLTLQSVVSGPLQAQDQQQQASRGSITGIVTDATSGSGLSQVSVVVTGTSLGTITNAQGRYTIANVSPGIVSLTVKRLGYSALSVPDLRVAAGTATNRDIKLSQQALIISAVVTTGVSDPTAGTKAPFSVATVGTEQLQVSALGSPVEALAGKVAGLSVVSSTGQPGSDVVIQIRNPLSFSGNTQPLIIIDGVIQMQDDASLNARSIAGNPIDINPELIESIEVVRGAAAAAIYGQKAANGVINITTKRGGDLTLGTTRLTVSSENGYSKLHGFLPINLHHRRTVDENNQFVDNFGRPIEGRAFANDPNQIVDNEWGVPIYNNLAGVFKTGSTILANINLSQSTLSTNFSISGGASNETGVVKTPEGGLSRQNIGMSLDYRAGERLSAGLGLAYNRQFQKFINNGINIFRASQDIAQDINMQAINPVTGDYFPFPDGTDDDRFNPLFFEPKRDRYERRIGIQANGNATYRPTSILSFNVLGGYGRQDRQNQLQFIFPGYLQEDGGTDEGSYDIASDMDEAFNTSMRGSVLTGFGGVTFRSSITLGGTVEKRHGFEVRGDSLFQSAPDLDFASRVQADEVTRDQRTLSVSYSAAFDYNAKYILDLVYRRDGNSLLPKASRWRGNGRASVAWNMSEETWWPVSALTLFKPRYSIGTAGNNPVFNAQYETYLQNTVNGIRTERIFKENMGNTEIKPEEVTEQEFGLDLSLMNKYSVSLNYVRNDVTNSIRADTIVSYTGFDTQQKNLGNLRGESYEATVEAQWINSRNFRWSSTLVADRSREKITSYPRRCGGPNITNTLERECEGFVFGNAYGLRHVVDMQKLNPLHITNGHLDWFDINDEGLVVAVDSGGSWTDMRWGQTVTVDGIAYAWGLPIREGIFNVDGVRTGSASVLLGQTLPDFAFGLGNQITVNRWSAHVQMVGQSGGLIFNREKMRRYNLEIHEDIDQFGKPEYAKKPISYYTNAVIATSGSGGLTGGSGEGPNAHTYFMEDATFLKISELRIGYRLDSGLPLLRRIGMTGGQLAVSARNLYTFTNYSGIDPQISGSAANTTSRVDDTSYPKYRTITATVRLIF